MMTMEPFDLKEATPEERAFLKKMSRLLDNAPESVRVQMAVLFNRNMKLVMRGNCCDGCTLAVLQTAHRYAFGVTYDLGIIDDGNSDGETVH